MQILYNKRNDNSKHQLISHEDAREYNKLKIRILYKIKYYCWLWCINKTPKHTYKKN